MKRRSFFAFFLLPFLASCKNPFKPESKPPPVERYDPDRAIADYVAYYPVENLSMNKGKAGGYWRIASLDGKYYVDEIPQMPYHILGTNPQERPFVIELRNYKRLKALGTHRTV